MSYHDDRRAGAPSCKRPVSPRRPIGTLTILGEGKEGRSCPPSAIAWVNGGVTHPAGVRKGALEGSRREEEKEEDWGGSARTLSDGTEGEKQEAEVVEAEYTEDDPDVDDEEDRLRRPSCRL